MNGHVASCHGQRSGAIAPEGAPVIALAGAPNVGKSTLFNALTGARRSVGNWPGTSVEIGRGMWNGMDLIDLPGAYSLDPTSPDEALTRELLVEVPDDQVPDVTIVATDAAHLARSLYLVAQLRERALKVVVALTMTDVAARRGNEIDTDALATALGVPVVAVDPRRKQGIAELAPVVDELLDAPAPTPRVMQGSDEFEIADDRFAWIDEAVAASVSERGTIRQAWSDKVDRIALHRFFGPLLFLGVMFVVFQITTTVAAPLQDGLDALIMGPISDAVRGLLDSIGAGQIVTGLIVDGIIAGVGMVLTFVPLMALMFILLAFLEDSGYMARAAVVADRVMRWMGLPGKAFLPLIVGFGCNVPAISATRILSSPRQRLLTALLVPFTSCSARLTVFVMIGSVFFPGRAGLVVFTMYLVSILLIVATGLLLKRTLWRTMGEEPLIMDLPPYQRPTLGVVTSSMWARLKGFLQTATGIILVTVVAVWALQAIPVRGDAAFAEVPAEDSAYGAVAQTAAPVFAPAGFGSWETTGALVTGFVAKEAVISSWAQTYAVADPEDGGDEQAFGDKVSASFEESSDGHPLPAVWAFMVFLLAYTPCVATLAAQRREIGIKWTAFGFAIQLATAWLLAVGIFQIGRLFW